MMDIIERIEQLQAYGLPLSNTDIDNVVKEINRLRAEMEKVTKENNELKIKYKFSSWKEGIGTLKDQLALERRALELACNSMLERVRNTKYIHRYDYWERSPDYFRKQAEKEKE